MPSKCCSKCGQERDLADFYRAAGTRDGLRGDCKSCFAERRRAGYDTEHEVARVTQWRKDNAERFAAYQAEYRNRPERKRAMRDLYYRRTYGISADEVDAMLEAQGGGCAVCGQRPDRPGSMHLDHDHLTGTLRGILCIDCNHGIGKLRDDPELLMAAVEYLRRTRRPSLRRSLASLRAV